MTQIVDVVRNDRADTAIINEAIETLSTVFTPESAVRVASNEEDGLIQRLR
jgi:hypothetical protein